ncbi:farnesol dehydrogenase-like [Sitophilus oryzae]|uniref:Farnesol dehydrogenase-like n=1 Tax=Sitophilus oryzae TaxID=7048 RepID=A0A6J2Y6E2_SITOR|nr:farnesol dehydrogenase-like [Sitophilus oryzae]
MVLSLERFQGEVAVVTGAAAGIGKAIVEELVKKGIIVAGLDIRPERLPEVALALSKEKGQLHVFKCDMKKEVEIKSTIREVIKKLGNIHILVNNAGVFQATDLINGDTEKWKTTIETNMLGNLIATREVVQNMKENNTEGHIVHINSILGHAVSDLPNLNVYPATQHAITALAETLRLDLKRENLNIKVTSISPGYVKTELQSAAGVGEIPSLNGSDVAEAVIYALATAPHINVSELRIEAVGS